MILSDIEFGPSPTDDDLAPYIAALAGAVEEIKPQLAAIQWEMDMRQRDPDSFLVPFSTWTGAFPVLGFSSYEKYRASQLWRKIRGEELRKADHKCRSCGRPTRIVHHRDYRPRVLAGDDRAALVVLCQPCHDHVHYSVDRKERTWNESERILRQTVIVGAGEGNTIVGPYRRGQAAFLEQLLEGGDRGVFAD